MIDINIIMRLLSGICFITAICLQVIETKSEQKWRDQLHKEWLSHIE